MSLRRRILLGCALVVTVLLATDVVLASTFRSFLLSRVDQQLEAAAAPLVRGQRFRGGPRGGEPGTDGRSPEEPARPPGQEDRFFTEFFVGVLGSDGQVSRFGPGLRDDEHPPPQLSADALRDHIVERGARLEPFTTSAGTVEARGGSWRPTPAMARSSS